MPDSRTGILGRIRAGIAPALAGPEAEYRQLPRAYSRAGRLDTEARLQLFTDRLRDYDAAVRLSDAASLPHTVAEILGSRGQKKVIAADGLQILPGHFFLAEREAGVEDLNGCDGIITVCTVAIAVTGTIVLAHGPGEGARRLTLLPDRHLCIVRAGQVVESVPEAFDRLAGVAARPLTFISGPSATADIEMTRIRGVHGPRFLDVVLVR